MPYDPLERRRTPLVAKLQDRIRHAGPISVADYMRTCLFDRDHGYYKTGAVLGRDGDFITAPEISQTFGELIGLWCVAVWQQMGAPKRVQVVEFGAGRGTLLQDALRAAQKFTAFFDALTVAILDTHPGLKEAQARTLQNYAAKVSWPEEIGSLNAVPTLLIANELIDCLPIEQFVATADASVGWQRRCVGLDESNNLEFVVGQPGQLEPTNLPNELDPFKDAMARAKQGDIIETRSLTRSEFPNLKEFVFKLETNTVPFAGLFIDYGHTNSAIGDTLQAVRNHAFEHPLTSPGEADLTAHVDFDQFAAQMRADGFEIDGPVSQGTFLNRLGVVERASALMAHNPGHATDIEAAIARLVSPTGMGGQFQAIAVRSPDLAPLPGLTP